MRPDVFREYDIRGVVGTQLYIQDVRAFGRVCAAYFMHIDSAITTVLIGRDGREHSPAIFQELSLGLQEGGLQVVDIGVCHTPLVSFMLHVHPQKYHAGIMITASHNGPAYNGFKLYCGTQAIFGDQVRELAHRWVRDAGRTVLPAMTGSCTGESGYDEYSAILAHKFRNLMGTSGDIIFDCGGGALTGALTKVLERLHLKNSQILHGGLDPLFIERGPDPTKPGALSRLIEVIKTTATKNSFGIAFDGDGDRVVVVTESGRVLSGDQLLGILARGARVTPKTIVAEVTASDALEAFVAPQGTAVVWAPTGVARVKRVMQHTHAAIGGEVSGHYILTDEYYDFDDALYTALRILELRNRLGISLDELISQWPKRVSSGTLRLACEPTMREEIIAAVQQAIAMHTDATINSIDGVRAQWDYGWCVVRASNTEPVLSVRYEGHTAQDAATIARILRMAGVPLMG